MCELAIVRQISCMFNCLSVRFCTTDFFCRNFEAKNPFLQMVSLDFFSTIGVNKIFFKI